MDKSYKISLVLAGLLLLTCGLVAGAGLWALSTGTGGAALAAITGRTPTPLVQPTAVSTETSQNAVKANPRALALGKLGGAFGTVQSVNGDSITVAGPRGATKTLTLADATRVIIAGIPNATVKDLQVGDKVLVLGVKLAADLKPAAIIAAPASYDKANVRLGRLQSATDSTLTLATMNGTLTVGLSGAQVFAQKLQPVQAASLPAGSQVLVIGQPASGGGFQAQLVIAREPPKNANPARAPNATPTP